MKTLRVLIVEDNDDDAELLLRQLRKANYEVIPGRAETAQELRAALQESTWDVVLSDYGMRDFNGLDALEVLQSTGLDIPFVIISGSIGEEIAASLMRHGVSDYLMKDNLERLAPAIAREMHEAENRRDKREAEVALAESEERLKLALSAAGMGAWEWDLRSDEMIWSRECSVIWGILVAGAKADDVRLLIVPEDREMVKDRYRFAISSKTAINVKYRIKRSDGLIVWLTESAKCQYKDGKPTRVVGTLRDITRDKQAEDALVEAEHRYRIIAETASDAVISTDSRGKILFANPSTEGIFGYKRDELIGKPVTMLMPEHTKHRHVDGLDNYIDTGVRRADWNRTEGVGIRKDGVEIAVQISFGEYKTETQHVFTAFVRDITKQKEAQDQIVESEKIFRALVEATTQYVWQLDENGLNTGIPHWWFELTGQSIEESYNYGWLECIHPEDRERVKSSYEYGISTITTVTVHLRLKTAESGYRHFVARGVPIPDTEGARARWVCTLTDINDRMSAEYALRRSEQRLRTILNTEPECVKVLSLKGEIVEINPAGINFLEADSAEMVIGRTAVGVLHKEYADEFNRALGKVSEGEAVEMEYAIKGFKGTDRLLSMQAVPLRNSEGEIDAILAVSRDMTEKRATEVALRESEARYRNLFENNPYPMWVYDVDTLNFMAVNESAVTHYGYNRDEFMSMKLTDIRPVEDREAVAQIVKSNALAEKAHHTRRHTRKNGEVIHVEVTSHPLEYEGKQARLVLAHDISERAAAEDKLRASEDQLRQIQKLESIGTLAGGMAHDFNNMLTAINGYSDLILRKISGEDPIRKNLLEIRKAGERSAELTRQLLAFSRRQIMQPQLIDLNDIIGETTGMMQRLIGKGISIKTNLESNLASIEADPGQISQVVVNLVINARDAMPDGGTINIETGSVTLDAEYASRHIDVVPGDYVMLSVSDNGTGMDETTRERVFEPFFTTKSIGRGTGLGLSTAYGIVKQSGGNIWVYSELGVGTTFKIFMPSSAADPSDAQPDVGQHDLHLGSEKILLVEDEDSVRSLAREILESCGYTITEARDGAEAVELLKACGGDFELIITDIVMPVMGGHELAKYVEANFPSIKILCTSGYTDDAVALHGLIDDGLNFLQKPFTFAALSHKVRMVLDSK